MSKHFFPGDSCRMRSRSPSWDETGLSTSHALLKVSGKCHMSEPSRHAPPRPLPGDRGQAAWSRDGQAQRSRFEPSEKPAELGAAGKRTTFSHKPLQPGHSDTHPRLRGWMGRVRGVRAGETTHVVKADPRLGAPNQPRPCSHWDSSKSYVQRSFYIQQSRLVQLKDPFHWEIPVSHQSVQSNAQSVTPPESLALDLVLESHLGITPTACPQRAPCQCLTQTQQWATVGKVTRDTRGSDAWHLEGREEQVREDSLGREDENWTWKDPAARPAWMKAAGVKHWRCRLQRTPSVAGSPGGAHLQGCVSLPCPGCTLWPRPFQDPQWGWDQGRGAHRSFLCWAWGKNVAPKAVSGDQGSYISTAPPKGWGECFLNPLPVYYFNFIPYIPMHRHKCPWLHSCVFFPFPFQLGSCISLSSPLHQCLSLLQPLPPGTPCSQQHESGTSQETEGVLIQCSRGL